MSGGPEEAILLAVALLFAWNLGAHYTGATMGMPYASRSISLWPALAIVAIFSLLGATFASGKVEATVGLRLIAAREVSIVTAIVIVSCGCALTMAFNYLRLPTSTIQILVFCLLGAAVSAGLAVRWMTLVELLIAWLCAPLAAALMGFVLTRAIDRVLAPWAEAAPAARQLEHPGEGQPERPALAGAALRAAPVALVAVGVCASFAMGSNDVANATGALLLAHLVSPEAAGAIGGAGLFLGALTWGRRILERVAFDVVRMDLAMASAAQGVQALVVILAVSQGLFTSMNQALVAAMAGTGAARGRQTVDRAQLAGILRGWLIGPAAGFALAYLAELLAR
ncbi:MAG TPA: inorganic phosphate transporter [Solirubrobacteraceae bacterium]|nr:inorganic phosphate transporter [Solirubrobacteraceae bacterium]